MEAEAERTRRTEHVQETALRGLGKRDLTRGWQAWLPSYWYISLPPHTTVDAIHSPRIQSRTRTEQDDRVG